MKRFLWLSTVFVGLLSTTAFADHLYLQVNTGSGDNFAYGTEMNGHLQLGGVIHIRGEEHVERSAVAELLREVPDDR